MTNQGDVAKVDPGRGQVELASEVVSANVASG